MLAASLQLLLHDLDPFVMDRWSLLGLRVGRRSGSVAHVPWALDAGVLAGPRDEGVAWAGPAGPVELGEVRPLLGDVEMPLARAFASGVGTALLLREVFGGPLAPIDLRYVRARQDKTQGPHRERPRVGATLILVLEAREVGRAAVSAGGSLDAAPGTGLAPHIHGARATRPRVARHADALAAGIMILVGGGRLLGEQPPLRAGEVLLCLVVCFADPEETSSRAGHRKAEEAQNLQGGNVLTENRPAASLTLGNEGWTGSACRDRVTE